MVVRKTAPPPDAGPAAPERRSSFAVLRHRDFRLLWLGQLVSMIPGMGSMAKDAQDAVDRGDLKRTEAIIRSMTRHERRDPTVLNGSRRRRIATGSGTSLTEVNRLVKQFTEMQRLMKQLAGGRGRGMLGGMPFGR